MIQINYLGRAASIKIEEGIAGLDSEDAVDMDTRTWDRPDPVGGIDNDVWADVLGEVENPLDLTPNQLQYILECSTSIRLVRVDEETVVLEYNAKVPVALSNKDICSVVARWLDRSNQDNPKQGYLFFNGKEEVKVYTWKTLPLYLRVLVNTADNETIRRLQDMVDERGLTMKTIPFSYEILKKYRTTESVCEFLERIGCHDHYMRVLICGALWFQKLELKEMTWVINYTVMTAGLDDKLLCYHPDVDAKKPEESAGCMLDHPWCEKLFGDAIENGIMKDGLQMYRHISDDLEADLRVQYEVPDSDEEGPSFASGGILPPKMETNFQEFHRTIEYPIVRQ